MIGQDAQHSLVEQRVRNRQIETLQLAASWPEQIAYQRSVPDISVPNEIFNQWDDVVPNGESTRFPHPLYSEQEVKSLLSFAKTMDTISAATPNPLPSLEKTFELSAWEELRGAAQETLNVMMLRGAFSDEALEKDLD